MAALVFPQLPGLTWPVDREIGNFDTTTQLAMSGKKTVFANRTQAQYRYTLTINAMDSSGARPALTANSFQTLFGFYNQSLGGALLFNFWDAEDHAASMQQFGIGDGVTTAFQLARSIGGWADNIFAPLAPSAPTLIPSASNPNNSALNVYAPNNLLKFSNTFSNAAWSITNGTVANTVSDPFGGTTAWTMTATAGNAQLSQVNIVTNNGAAFVNSLWMRRRTGTGTVALIDPNGTLQTVTLTGAWQRFAFGAVPAGNPTIGVRIVTNADAVDIYGAQCEQSTITTAGSYIPTTISNNPGAPQIFVAGAIQDPSTYSIGATGVVTFGSAPSSLAALTWTGSYYWPCNFDDDSLTLSKFMGGLVEAKSIKFTTRVF